MLLLSLHKWAFTPEQNINLFLFNRSCVKLEKLASLHSRKLCSNQPTNQAKNWLNSQFLVDLTWIFQLFLNFSQQCFWKVVYYLHKLCLNTLLTKNQHHQLFSCKPHVRKWPLRPMPPLFLRHAHCSKIVKKI